ncbi:MAG: tetratricopeptide repeat protein [Drouetiella hepatica Uher 2000/2452]|uniref:Tetratricopeptide repeat protein n=1 Tax=Drouetiella hepatica Uher 2000/2452 TaxID=904376 RepID=A0A951ULP7_9CYAN|nr:tetratricopeptide repeat protein [Drouetiella hepatica Uher 2000/2452]
MRRHVHIGSGLIGIVAASWIGFPAVVAQGSPSQLVSQVTLPSTQEQPQRLQEANRMQDLQQELQMRKVVQEEVDRAFNHTTALLNVLLAILTVLPIIATVLLYLSRQRAIQQLREEMDEQIRKEIEAQVQAELKQQTLIIQKQMLELGQESLAVTRQVQQQASEFQAEIDQLKTEFETQLEALKSAATEVEREKDRIFQQITSITLVATSKDELSDEKKRKIETLTEQLDHLKSKSSSLDLCINDFVREGDALFFAGRYAEAIHAYDQAIGKTLVDVDDLFAAWHGKTKALRRLRQYPQALAASTRAMALKPDDSLMWFERGYLLHIQGQYAEALEIYDRLIANQPSFYRARNHRGYVLLKLKRYEEAIAELNKSIEIKPDYGNGYYGKAYYYLLHDQPDLALENLKISIAYYPRYKTRVKTDSDFASLWDNYHFQDLVGISVASKSVIQE